MLKCIVYLLFMMPLMFMGTFWWVIQAGLFIVFFFLLANSCVGLSPGGIGYNLLVDTLSYSLILLSVWIGILMIMASGGVFNSSFYREGFIMLVLGLLLFLCLSFMSSSLFMFYLFFESSLVPTLILILGWGYQPERVQAGIYMLFYTLFASLPLLVGIFWVGETLGSLELHSFLWIEYMMGCNYNFVSCFWYFTLVGAFLVSMPMFLVHLWLPSAHVEAPISGSMVLAGVLLKLGGYGLLRIYPFIEFVAVKLNLIWFSISIVGGLIVSFVCMCQVDMKSLIAYSSVAHMGLVLMGIMTLGCWGFKGAVVLMIGHGLCSSGLFCLANMSYERLGSRSLLISRGMLGFSPSLTLWWFMLSVTNMAAPPTLNLLGEIGLLNGIVGWSCLSMLGLGLLSFFSAVYTLYLYSYSQHGKFYSGNYSCWAGSFREYLVLFLHWFPLNLLILYSGPVLEWI